MRRPRAGRDIGDARIAQATGTSLMRRHPPAGCVGSGSLRRAGSGTPPTPPRPRRKSEDGLPKRTDIKTILVLGSGPIVIGQGCEFDYSGTQACKALKAEGYRIVLVNSNPATIMTDPAFSDRTYIEPITPDSVRKIVEKENALGPRIDAILPTLGGQTALNCACALWDNGTLTKHSIEMIGANREVIHRAEDRQAFKEFVEKLGLKLPRAKTVNSIEDAMTWLEEIGLPAIIRPAFTL